MNKKSIEKLLQISQTPFPWIIAVGCGLVLGYVAFHSSGFDWYISDIQAEVIYSALHNYHELPVFSYFIDGGAYLLQDPQSFLLTPVTPLILIFGPHAGIRVAIAIWGTVGCLGMYYLLRTSLGKLPALFTGVVWVLSLGMFWRIIVGNDMFAWNLGLPWLLILIQRLYTRPNFSRSLCLGVFLGLYLLGPTFHTFTYLFFPAGVVWAGYQLFAQKKIIKLYWLKALVFTVSAILVAVLLALPKLYAFTKFDLSRTTCSEGTIAKTDAWDALFNQERVLDGDHLTAPYQQVICQIYSYGNWEANVAFFPIAYIFIFVFVISFFWKDNRQITVLAVMLVVMGWLLATTGSIWAFIRLFSHSGIRVSSRFLQLVAFGLALFVGVGYARVQRQASFVGRFLLFVLCCMLFSLQMAGWTYEAATLQSDYHGTIRPLLSQAAVSMIDAAPVTSYQNSVQTNREADHSIYNGQYLLNGFYITGNDTLHSGTSIDDTEIMKFFNSATKNDDNTFSLSPQLNSARLQVTHNQIKVSQLQPGESVTIYLRAAQLGQTLQVTPKVPVTITTTDFSQTVTNTSGQVITGLVIKPILPTHWIIWVIWFVVWIGALGYGFRSLWYTYRHANNL